MLLPSGTAVFANLGNNLEVVCFFVKSHPGLAILEQDHGGALLGTIPQLGQFGIVLLLDAADCASILEQGLGAEDVVLDGFLGVGVVEVDEDGLVIWEEVEDLVH